MNIYILISSTIEETLIQNSYKLRNLVETTNFDEGRDENSCCDDEK